MRLILVIWLTFSVIASLAVLSACVAAGRADESWRRALQKRGDGDLPGRSQPAPACKVSRRPLDIWRERRRQRYAQISRPARVRVLPVRRPTRMPPHSLR